MKIYDAIETERNLAKAKFNDLDKINTVDDYILYTLAYLGRATSAERNKDIDRKSMLIKAAGLLVTAIEKDNA